MRNQTVELNVATFSELSFAVHWLVLSTSPTLRSSCQG